MSNDPEAVLKAELHKIAPDVEVSDIETSGDLREEFDIDSMDFLNLVTALSKALGVEIPEEDYPKMGTYDDAVAYLRGKVSNAA